jgi:hypothetical protein
MKTKLFSFVLMFTAFVNNKMFTQYMYNTININPAYAGSRGAFSIFALHRTQWVGLDAPVTNAASCESNLGLGVTIINDKIGPTTENTISTDVLHGSYF